MSEGCPLPPGVVIEPEEPIKGIPKPTIRFILDKCLHKDHRQDPTVLRFIDSYLHTWSVSEASRLVGITTPQGNNLKKRPDIFDAITQLTDVAVEKYGYNAHEVVERVKDVLNFDPIVLENPDGSYKNKLSEIPFEQRTAIKKFKVKNLFGIDANGIRTVIGEIIEVELYDRMKAAEMLGPEKNVFKPSVDVNTNIKISITGALAAAEERLLSSRDVTPEITDVE